jgi:threonine synthase
VRGHKIDAPETLATAIRIGNPASWKQAEAARDESGGLIDMVTDDEILEAYQLLASSEGVFVEPASAASVAGVIKLIKADYFVGAEGPVACVLTGHGLKDPNCAIKVAPPPIVVPAEVAAIREVLGY